MPKFRVIAPVLALGVAVSSFPLVSQSRQPSAMKTFTSPDGDFQFQYPERLINCQHLSDWEWTPESCLAYVPICGGTSSSYTTIACIAYPRERVGKNTTFEAAAFSASIVKGADKTKCLKITPPAAGHSRVKNSDGVQFTVGELGQAVMGNDVDGKVYRTFHNDTCYELDIVYEAVNPMNYPDPSQFKQFARAPVQKALQQALYSFKFLK